MLKPFWPGVLLLSLLSLPGMAAEPLLLVREGQALASIVPPASTEHEAWMAARLASLPERVKARNPQWTEAQLAAGIKRESEGFTKSQTAESDEEKLAAAELQEFLEKISGAKLAITPAAPGALPAGPAIVLGTAHARAAGLGPELDKLAPDGIFLRVVGERLYLAGRRARGTLYAAYEFLESLGCRWVMPGPFGECLPSLKTISTTIDKTQNPAHTQRYFWCTMGQGKEFPRWTLRNKGNAVSVAGEDKVAQGHALGGPLKWGATQPAYSIPGKVKKQTRQTGADGKPVILTEEVDGTVLPDEYYGMVGGKLQHAIPNMGNPKVWQLYTAYYKDYFTRNPEARYVSISAEDGLTVDERPEARRLDSFEYDYYMGSFSATDRMWFFHNRVLNEVVKDFPDKKFGVLVYADNMAPPRLERVHPNMALVFAPLGISPLHHVRDPRSKTNRGYHQWLLSWMEQAEAAGAETYYYDYEPTGFSWNVAMICPRWGIIGKNYPWFHQLGLDGHTTQGHDDWASCGLDNYLMQRLYWDVTPNYRAIIADYCRARFGAAAQAMEAYYRVYEDAMDAIPDLYSNEVWANHLILTPAVRATARERLAAAEKLADTEHARRQMATMALLQRSTDAFADAIEHARETGDFGQAAAMMETSFTIRDELNQLYSHFMNPWRMDKKTKAEYTTGGIYNQYLAFDARIKGSQAAMPLPRTVKMANDTANVAQARGWHKPNAKLDQATELADWDITICPDVKFNTQREVAAFFYRTEVTIPANFAGAARYELYFPSIIARALQVWVDGQPIKFKYPDYEDSIWRGPRYFWINYNHQLSVDLTGLLKPGQRQTLAFRVFKSHDFGGTYRRPYLLANAPEAAKP